MILSVVSFSFCLSHYIYWNLCETVVSASYGFILFKPHDSPKATPKKAFINVFPV